MIKKCQVGTSWYCVRKYENNMVLKTEFSNITVSSGLIRNKQLQLKVGPPPRGSVKFWVFWAAPTFV